MKQVDFCYIKEKQSQLNSEMYSYSPRITLLVQK